MNKLLLLFVCVFILLFSCTKNSIVTNGVVPESPSNFTAVAVDSTQVKLTWTDNSTNESGFHIEQLIQATWTQIVKLGPNVTTYTVKNLTPNTTYSFSVYSFNSAGNSKLNSNELIVKTPGYSPPPPPVPPRVPTVPAVFLGIIYRILPTSVTIQMAGVGNDTSLASPLTAMGVVWSTTSNPTIALTTKTSEPIVNGSGGSFNSFISGLTPSTTYYVKAYATNNIGTGYSKEDTFTTAKPPPPIESVTIGTQVWMLKNLDVDTYNNGDHIVNFSDNSYWISYSFNPGAMSCYFNNDSATYAKYGKLYNWYNIRNLNLLAPVGWHIPSVQEWNTLITYLGGESEAGGKMKESGTANWLAPNTGATNSSGFTGLPCGSRFGTNNSGDGNFYGFGLNCYYWTSTEVDALNASYVKLDYGNTNAVILPFNKSAGCYVRCIKD